MGAGVEDAEPGHNVESGLTHLSAHVTVNLGGHGLSGRAVVSMPHAIARFCYAAMAAILLEKHEFVSKKLRSSLGPSRRWQRGRASIVLLNGDVGWWWERLGWALPSLNTLTERCFIGQSAQLSAPMP